MLTEEQNKKYDEFYETTHNNEYLDSKTELLVGLSAAIAMNCQPCTKYYILNAKKAAIKQGEISEVIAKVMAVAAGQKKLQTLKVLNELNIDLTEFELNI